MCSFSRALTCCFSLPPLGCVSEKQSVSRHRIKVNTKLRVARNCVSRGTSSRQRLARLSPARCGWAPSLAGDGGVSGRDSVSVARRIVAVLSP